MWWPQLLWTRDKRVSLHEKQLWPNLQIQQKRGKDLDSLKWHEKATVLGAALDGHMLHKLEKRGFFCPCGTVNPARRHMMWHGREFSYLRSQLGIHTVPQRNTVAEGLVVQASRLSPFEQQLDPSIQHALSFQQSQSLKTMISNAYAQSSLQNTPLILGSDGASSSNVDGLP